MWLLIEGTSITPWARTQCVSRRPQRTYAGVSPSRRCSAVTTSAVHTCTQEAGTPTVPMIRAFSSSFHKRPLTREHCAASRAVGPCHMRRPTAVPSVVLSEGTPATSSHQPERGQNPRSRGPQAASTRHVSDVPGCPLQPSGPLSTSSQCPRV